jgi:stage II sporulation protein E
MDHYEDTTYDKLGEKSKVGSIQWVKEARKHFMRFIVSLIGFLISHVMIYQMNPMIIAYYAVVYLDKSSRIWMFITTLLGLSLALPILDFFKYLLIIILMITIITYQEIRGRQMSLVKHASIATGCTFAISYAYVFLQGNNTYLIILAVLESVTVFALTFIYSKSAAYIMQKEKKTQLNNEQIISFGILIASAIAGASELQFLQFSVRDTLVFTFIMYFGYRFGIGIGSVMGLMSGLILTTMSIIDPVLLGALGIIGILSGVFREIGKVGSAIGFSLGTLLLGYYFAPQLLEHNMLKALISSVVIFVFMPKQWVSKVDDVGEKIIVSHEYYKEKIQRLTKEKIKGFSVSFLKLSETFSLIADKREGLSQQEVNQIFDEVAEKVCKNCSMCSLCWQKEFYDTYKAAFSILGAAEKKGRVQKSDVPKDFSIKCIKLDEFVITTNRLFELFKINLSWHNRIVESRELVSEQLAGVANILENFSEEIYNNIDLEKKLEKELEQEIRKFPVSVRNIMVIENTNKRKEVHITIKGKKQESISSKELVNIISKIMKKRMRLEEGSKYITDEEYNTMKFVEERLFRTMQGISRTTKEGEKVSGDNFSFLDLSNGQTILALSDGMGTGLEACKESEAAIDLLEQFMEAGFDKTTAIKMINSVLVLKSNEHSFSTIDMSIIDMYTGVCEFIKIGAASTFIKRSDSVETIKSTSLPVGVFNKVDFDTTTRKLYEGDFLVMVTDGIVDADTELIEKETWIEDALMEIKSKNPQEIADCLLERAKEKVGHKIQDDMTVLVSKIWKK